MKIKNLLLTAAVAASTLVPSAALASTRVQKYTFRRAIGGVHIRNASVSKRSNSRGTRIYTDFVLPTCSSHRYLSGYVKVSYVSRDNGYMKNYTVYRATRSVNNEGNRLQRSVYSNSKMSTDGTLTYNVNLVCRSLNRY